MRVEITLERVVITLHECHIHNYTLRVKSHSACGNRTLRVEITLVRVKTTVVWKLHSTSINHTRACRYHTCECHNHTHTCRNYSRVRGNHTLCLKTHSACINRTLRVEINLVRVEITLVRFGIIFVPV
jgi:hypothetical protein